MATVSSVPVKCNHCGAIHKVDVYSSINLSQDPELKDNLRNGSIFVWECPHCGQSNLVKYPLLYHDPENKVMIWLLPEGSVSEQQISALSSQLEGLDGYVLRRVEEVGDFIEKIGIFDAGLDDRVIEMCKYVTKMELAEKVGKAKAESIFTAPFKFYRLDGADNEILLTYPSEGKMEGVNIGFNVYEDCSGIVSRNAAITAVKGFATVNQTWITSIMR